MAEIRRAEAADSPYQPLFETALNCIGDGNRRYVEADPYVKRLLNDQLLERVEIKGGELVSVELKPPFHGLVLLAGSNKGSLVRGTGFEPGPSRSRNMRRAHGGQVRNRRRSWRPRILTPSRRWTPTGWTR